MKTYSPKASDLRPQWHVVDAAGQTLGRLAVRVAHLLKGKHKPIYSPHVNTGDFVIVINTRHIKVTGRKTEQKIYYRHSQYPGGLRATPLSEMLVKHPTRVVEHAVKGMLPHNRLGRQMMRRLKLYPDAAHPHEAQVTASIKVAEKMDTEGPVWIGLPKPVIHRRPKRKKVRAPVAEAVAGAETPEQPSEAPAEAMVTQAAPVAGEVTETSTEPELPEPAAEAEASVTGPVEEVAEAPAGPEQTEATTEAEEAQIAEPAAEAETEQVAEPSTEVVMAQEAPAAVAEEATEVPTEPEPAEPEQTEATIEAETQVAEAAPEAVEETGEEQPASPPEDASTPDIAGEEPAAEETEEKKE